MSDNVQRYFDRQSLQWDDLYRTGAQRLFNRVLRKGVYLRAEIAVRAMAPEPGKRLLDVGCGSGVISVAMANRGAQVTGIDLSASMLELARGRAESDGVADLCTFSQGDVLGLQPDRTFDGSYALGVFDYVQEPVDLLRVMRAVTEGPTVASFPSRSLLRAPLRKLRYGVRGCPVYFYTARQIERLYAEVGFVDVELNERPDGWIVVAHSRSGAEPCFEASPVLGSLA